MSRALNVSQIRNAINVLKELAEGKTFKITISTGGEYEIGMDADGNIGFLVSKFTITPFKNVLRDDESFLVNMDMSVSEFLHLFANTVVIPKEDIR